MIIERLHYDIKKAFKILYKELDLNIKGKLWDNDISYIITDFIYQLYDLWRSRDSRSTLVNKDNNICVNIRAGIFKLKDQVITFIPLFDLANRTCCMLDAINTILFDNIKLKDIPKKIELIQENVDDSTFSIQTHQLTLYLCQEKNPCQINNYKLYLSTSSSDARNIIWVLYSCDKTILWKQYSNIIMDEKDFLCSNSNINLPQKYKFLL